MLFHIGSLASQICCCCSVVKWCLTLCHPWTAACHAPLSFTALGFIQIHVHRVGDAIRPSHPPFSVCFQPFPAAGSFPMSWVFESGGHTIGASASAASPSNEYSVLIFFRIDRLISLLSKDLGLDNTDQASRL